MSNDGTLRVKVVGDVADFQKKMGDSGSALGKLGGAAEDLAKRGFQALTRSSDDLQRAQGNFQRATGASRAEAQAFGRDMLSLVGNNNTVGMSLEDVAEAGSQVAQQFGLTGKAGTDLTDKFLAFAKVTATDAAGAVNQFDAILDAFHEPAENAVGIMDALIASNQKYGTDAGPAALEAIQNMAPALQAMGEGTDYAVGVLNLFEDAGLKAGDAQIAFNKALDDIPPGGSFDDIIAKLGAIEDPALRDAAAVEIFGEKAGHKMANAIKPGMTSLDEFKVNMQEVAGTTGRAADDMTTAGDKVKGFFEKLRAGVLGITGEWAPMLSGMGGVATALGPMGLNLGKVTSALWLKVAALKAAQGGWLGMLGAMGPAAAVTGGVAVGLIGVNEGLNMVSEKARASADELRGLTDEQRETARSTEVLGMKVGDITEHFANMVGALVPWHQVATDARVVTDLLNDTFEQTGPGLDAMGQRWMGYARSVQTSMHDTSASVADSTSTTGAALGDMGDDMRLLRDVVGEASADAAAEFHERMVEMHQDAAWAGAKTPGEFADGARSAFNNVTSAFTELRDLMKNTLSPAEQEAELIGIATSRRLAKGLDDERPEVRGTAQQIALDTIAKLHALAPDSEAIGTLAMQLLASATEAEKPALRDALDAILNVAENQLDGMPDIASDAGNRTGLALADALHSAAVKRAVRDASSDLANIVKRGFLLESPAEEGPWSEKGGPIAWMSSAGHRMGEALATALRRAGRSARSALDEYGGLERAFGGALGPVLGAGGPMAAAAGGYGGAPITVNAYGADDVEQQLRRAMRREKLRNSLQGG